MAANRAQVRQVVDSPAFDQVFDDYEGQLFIQFMSEPDPVARERLYAKCQVAREVKQQLKNTVVDINGSDAAA